MKVAVCICFLALVATATSSLLSDLIPKPGRLPIPLPGIGQGSDQDSSSSESSENSSDSSSSSDSDESGSSSDDDSSSLNPVDVANKLLNALEEWRSHQRPLQCNSASTSPATSSPSTTPEPSSSPASDEPVSTEPSTSGPSSTQDTTTASSATSSASRSSSHNPSTTSSGPSRGIQKRDIISNLGNIGQQFTEKGLHNLLCSLSKVDFSKIPEGPQVPPLPQLPQFDLTGTKKGLQDARQRIVQRLANGATDAHNAILRGLRSALRSAQPVIGLATLGANVIRAYLDVAVRVAFPVKLALLKEGLSVAGSIFHSLTSVKQVSGAIHFG